MQDKKYDTFLSYQFTGIDPEIRKENISKIINLLESEGRKVFCSDILEEEFDKRNLSLEERYQECLRVQESQDFKEIVFFVMDKPESKGMKLELEKAKERKQKGRLIILENVEKDEELEWLKPFKEFCNNKIQIL